MRRSEREQRWGMLMRASNAGDATAYKRLLTELTPALRAAARRGLGAAGLADTDAEDVVQETLLAIHLKRQSFDGNAPFGPWLAVIARHKMIDAWRRHGRRTKLPIDNFTEILADGSAEPDLIAHDVSRHVESLPPRQRAAVRAIAIDGATIAEAATRLSMTNGAVRVALHRGLAGLARKFRTEPL